MPFRITVLGLVLLMVACSNQSMEQITSEELQSMISNNEDFVLLDVREQDEWEEGHIPGAVLAPLSRISQGDQAAWRQLEKYKDQKLVVYCRTGRRSAIIAQELDARGFEVYDLTGGISDWEAPLQK